MECEFRAVVRRSSHGLATSPNVRWFVVAIAFSLLATVSRTSHAAPILFTGPTYEQDFDSLPSSGSFFDADQTNPVALSNGLTQSIDGVDGWQIWKRLGQASDTYLRASNGISELQGMFSYGNSGETERALGAFVGAANVYSFGVVLTNTTGATIDHFELSYYGEQWRKGGTLTPNTLTFEFAIGEIMQINQGTYQNTTELDLSSPNLTPGKTRLNGNDPSNRILIGHRVEGIEWNPGEQLVLRWSDVDDPGNDDGLAIDDLVLSVPEPSSILMLGLGACGAGIFRRRSRRAKIS